MKSYIRTLALFIGILSGGSIFAQKQTPTPEAYQEWKRIDSPERLDLAHATAFRSLSEKTSLPDWMKGHLKF